MSPPPDGKTTGAEPSSSRVAHTVFPENRVGGAARSTGTADQAPDTTTSPSLLDQAGSFLAAAYNELLAPQTAHAWSGSALLADGIRFYHTDHLGSVRVITKGDASIQEVIDYDPFGAIIMDTKSGFEQDRNKYTGQMFDYMTGLYYYGARYYDAETGRFTQADTIVPNPLEAQDFNRYSYCGNNPMKYVDPSGHWYFTGSPVGWACAFIGAIIGAVIGGIAGSFMGNWQGGMAYGFESGWNFGMQFGTMWQYAPNEPPPEAPGVEEQNSTNALQPSDMDILASRVSSAKNGPGSSSREINIAAFREAAAEASIMLRNQDPSQTNPARIQGAIDNIRWVAEHWPIPGDGISPLPGKGFMLKLADHLQTQYNEGNIGMVRVGDDTWKSYKKRGVDTNWKSWFDPRAGNNGKGKIFLRSDLNDKLLEIQLVHEGVHSYLFNYQHQDYLSDPDLPQKPARSHSPAYNVEDAYSIRRDDILKSRPEK